MEEAWAELEQRGTEPELNELDELDAVISRTERVPDASWTGGVVMLLDTAPGFERMEQLYEWGTRKVPRMRDRVVDPVVPVGRPGARPALRGSQPPIPRRAAGPGHAGPADALG